MKGAYAGAAALGVAIAALTANTGWAQTPSPMNFWQFSAGQVLAPYGDEAPKWIVIAGPTEVYRPEYEGSEHYEIKTGAILNIRHRSGLFLSTGEGLGYDFYRSRNIRASIAIGYDLGRNDKFDGIRHMGGVNAAPLFKISLDYVFRPRFASHEVPVILSLNIRHAVGGYKGTSGDVGLYIPIAGSREARYAVFFGGTVTFDGDKAVDTYFGVTPKQSAETGYPVYNPGQGIRAAGAGISAAWFFSKHMMLTTNVGAKTLVGDAEGSPIVKDPWQFSSTVGVAYRF